MSIARRLEHLERVEFERGLYRQAERIATAHNRTVDDVLRQLHEIAARIDRWGIDVEHARLAQQYGISVDEVERLYQEFLASNGASLLPDSDL